LSLFLSSHIPHHTLRISKHDAHQSTSKIPTSPQYTKHHNNKHSQPLNKLQRLICVTPNSTSQFLNFFQTPSKTYKLTTKNTHRQQIFSTSSHHHISTSSICIFLSRYSRWKKCTFSKSKIFKVKSIFGSNVLKSIIKKNH